MHSPHIIAHLESEGWELRHVRGSHPQFKHPLRPGRLTVPHPQKDIPIKTLRSIYRQAGWESK